MPAFISIAKSPNSCGNSWQNTASEVEKPPAMFSAKAAPKTYEEIYECDHTKIELKQHCQKIEGCPLFFLACESK